MAEGVYVYGAGGHSLVVIDVLRDRGIPVLGVFADEGARHPRHGEVAPGVRMVGVGPFRCVDGPFVMAIGNNTERAEVSAMLPVEFAVVIHSSVLIAPSVTVGDGTVILHDAIVQANAQIGRHVLINTAASVDHDNIIGDYAHISPHATLCGHVEVGEGTHVGAGAIIIPKIKVGKWSTVGAGAVVIKDVPDGATVVGNPARIVRKATGQRRPLWEGAVHDRVI
jgi:sugar O-acyltransferase (sialic acid O-acetyltransferase NeuD family)